MKTKIYWKKHFILNPILRKAIICAVLATSPLPNALNYAFKCKPREESGHVGSLSSEHRRLQGGGTLRSSHRPSGRPLARPPQRCPHRHQPFTGFLEPGFGLRLARLTRGRARIRSRPLAPPPPAGAAMTRRPGTSTGALRHLRAHVIGGRCFTAAAPPLSYCSVRGAVCPRRAWNLESGFWRREWVEGVGGWGGKECGHVIFYFF